MEPLHVVITGASRGLGKAMAQKFASAGHHLYLVSRSDAALYQTMQSLQAEYPGITIKSKTFDFSESGNAIACGEWILKYGTAIDILVNNAGIFFTGLHYDEEKGALETQMEVNFFSAYHLSRTLIPVMKARGSGHIFNISSIAALGSLSTRQQL